MKLRAALHLHGRSRHNAAGRELMGADNQAEGVPERKRLSAIAKIKQDFALAQRDWCSHDEEHHTHARAGRRASRRV
jgi:hypothetical protein